MFAEQLFIPFLSPMTKTNRWPGWMRRSRAMSRFMCKILCNPRNSFG